jgi:hypothetical protein
MISLLKQSTSLMAGSFPFKGGFQTCFTCWQI